MAQTAPEMKMETTGGSNSQSADDAALSAKVMPEEAVAPEPNGEAPAEVPVAAQEESVYNELSCQSMNIDNPLRAICIVIYESPWFDRFTLSMIACNCVTLALFDPLDTECENRCAVLNPIDKTLGIYFTVEMAIKMIALGVWRCGDESLKEVYMDSAWNRFDCFIVITGLIDFIPGLDGGSLSSLRTFRVLRPLRAINKFPKLKILVTILLDTIPMLASVGMLCFLIFFVFGILAVQFWMGVMHQRCFDPSVSRSSANYATSYYQTDDGDDGDPYICSMGASDAESGLAACLPSQGVPAQFSACRPDGPTPLSGAIHYDNILAAWVVLFQIITLEGWVDQMYYVQGAFNFHTGWVYFCTLVVIGSFFAVNLALVVISSQFSNSKGGEMEALEIREAEEAAANKAAYEERKRLGIKPTTYELIVSGEFFDKPEEVLEAEREERTALLTKIAEGMDDGTAKEVVLHDLELVKGRVVFPITEAEAYEKGGIEIHRYEMRKITVIRDEFGNFIMGAIAVNVLLMACEHHPQPDDLTTFLWIANYIFCTIFAVEMLLKWFALGFAEYFSDNFNSFDCLIVWISLIEIILGGGGLAVLRMLRLVRVFKLIKFLPMLQRQIMIIGQTLGSVASFLLLLALFIFIFAVLGMFIFGGQLTWSETDNNGTYSVTSRKNFDTLLWALITIFQTLTLEDWNAGMYDAVRGTKTQWASLYYIILIMFGNYIMFNLFVAILIDGFAAEDDEPEEEEETVVVYDEELTDTLMGPRRGSRRVSRIEADAMIAAKQQKEAEANSATGSGVGAWSASASGKGSATGVEGDGAGVQNLEAVGSTPVENLESGAVGETGAKYVAGEEEAPGSAPKDCYEEDKSLFLFPVDNPFRIQCNIIASMPEFDQFIMGCIVVNSICMAMERPSIDSDSSERLALDILGHIFTFIFSVEMLIKWVATGVWWSPAPYWSNPWNRLDGIIVLISWLDLVLTVIGVSGGALELLKLCKMLRALRPLRAISRIPGLKKIVNVLVLSLAPIGTTLIIVASFFFLFGILGGQIFAGMFWHCDGADRVQLVTIHTKADCESVMGVDAWSNRPYNFDHLGNSLMTLFVLSSIDGWVEIMYHGIDSVGVDMQPKENHRQGLAFFFVGFLLIGGFFIINMFVGVIVENFQKHGAPDPNAPKEVEPPEPPFDDFENEENYSEFRRQVVTHACSQVFESFIAGVIILNVLVMGSEHYDPEKATFENEYDGMSDGFKLYLRLTNYLFTLIFIYELVVKYYAFGFSRFHYGSYPRSLPGWNNFDCFIVFISIVGILFDDIIGADNLPIDPAILRILRILRVARILKLVKSAKDLMILLTTVSRSLAQVGNLGTLLFLLFFIYSTLGIELFGRLDCTDANGCDGLSEYANFKNFGMAMLVLFRLSTGDNWNGMMKDGLRESPPESTNNALISQYGNKYGCDFAVDCATNCCAGCDIEEDCKENCCASHAMTPLFYISFCVLSTFVMLNLVVATLMGELERAGIEGDQGPVKAEESGDSKEVDATPVTEFKKSDPASSLLEAESPKEKEPLDKEPITEKPPLEKPPRPTSPPTVFEPFVPGVVDNNPEPNESDGQVVVPSMGTEQVVPPASS